MLSQWNLPYNNINLLIIEKKKKNTQFDLSVIIYVHCIQYNPFLNACLLCLFVMATAKPWQYYNFSLKSLNFSLKCLIPTYKTTVKENIELHNLTFKMLYLMKHSPGDH